MAQKLFLIPVPIGENDNILPHNIGIISTLEYFFAEDLRTARRFISSLKTGKNIESLYFEKLDKDTKNVAELFAKVPQTANIGIMSEAGCPGIADPGALAVAFAHQKGMEVVPLTGSSSLLLALMASGLNGQSFAFLGYLPVKTEERKIEILDAVGKINKKGQAQIFIETPYRNDNLLRDLLRFFPDEISLCIAKGIHTDAQVIKTLKIRQWRENIPEIGKIPTVFIAGVPR